MLTPNEFCEIEVPELSPRSLAELVIVAQNLDQQVRSALAPAIQNLQREVECLQARVERLSRDVWAQRNGRKC